jgi:membrane protease YdiL (CAAX protease family)
MFPVPPLAPVTLLDAAFTAALALALPVHLYFSHRGEKRRDAEGQGHSRMQRYRGALGLIASLGGATLLVWAVSGRSWAELGFSASDNLYFLGGMGAVALACALLVAQSADVACNAKTRADIAKLLDGQAEVDKFVPRTAGEFRMWSLVSLAAGVFEEIVFRGFLIWALAHWVPVWAAAALSIAVFTLAHLYQESAGALARVVGMAVILTLVVVLSGSLYPAMLLHFAVDLSSGWATWHARRETARA